MNEIIIGKRIPIGAAVGGAIVGAVGLWNATHPDQVIEGAIVDGLKIVLVFVAQVIAVNYFGVTTK